MAQGVGVTIGAESGVLARPVLDDDSCISYDFVVGSQADSCRFYSEATLPENRAAQTCGVRPHIRVGRVFHAVFER